MQVRKVVIPVAGWGTRSLPATKNVPKEILPVFRKPSIQYIVEEAIASGLSDVVFVNNQNKRIIEDHFDYNLALEQLLERKGQYTYVEYARFADDMVILVDAHRRHDWLMKAVEKRLREEFVKLHVEINEEKSSIVDLRRGGSFGFLGFDFRRTSSIKGVWRPHYTPKLKKRTALLQKLKDVFRKHQSQPVDRIVALINPILRGWVNYFAVGNSSQCFNYIQDWVEKKIRRHLMRSRKRKGFGWQRWSRQWLYDGLGLFNGYRVSRSWSKATPAG